MAAPLSHARFGSLGNVCRLGLAARSDASLTEEDVAFALEQGVNFLNWPGTPDYLSRAIAGLGQRRDGVIVCAQLEARSGADAERELDGMLHQLRTDHVDVLTFYYVEAEAEWAEIDGRGGALEYCRRARAAGKVRLLGLTSHQRSLAATIASSGDIDMLMIRYNAAHRAAETEVFPVTQALGMPVVTYTSMRWGALLQATPDDPPDFQSPPAATWYQWVLQHPSVTVALMAPYSRSQLEDNLQVLKQPPLSHQEHLRLAEHGRRVRRHAGHFP
jgi:predicted aldo/keto reductase-like oxidoreductase